MKLINLFRRQRFTLLTGIAAIASLLLFAACGVQEQATPTATPQPIAVATATPAPTATAVPTNTPEPPTVAPTATDTPVPTNTPTSVPVPIIATSTITPTLAPVLLVQASEAKAIYHGAEIVEGIGRYKSGAEPWMDLLVRFDDTWYGPERQEDDINASPLPEGYRWETDGSFTSLPNGEAWWTGPGIEGNARLIGPDGSQIVTLRLKIELY